MLLKNVKNYNYLYKLKHFKKQLEKCGNMHVTCKLQQTKHTTKYDNKFCCIFQLYFKCLYKWHKWTATATRHHRHQHLHLVRTLLKYVFFFSFWFHVSKIIKDLIMCSQNQPPQIHIQLTHHIVIMSMTNHAHTSKISCHIYQLSIQKKM